METQSRITLITGGNRSGKSSYAESLCPADSVLYIATAIVTDEEMAARIQRHQKSRPETWRTLEGYRDLGSAAAEGEEDTILLDCVTNMISNLIFAQDQDVDALSKEGQDALYQAILKEFQDLVEGVRRTDKRLILVSNEVGMGLISEYKLGRLFVDFAGFINQYLAKQADDVIFMVSGLPLHLKESTCRPSYS